MGELLPLVYDDLRRIARSRLRVAGNDLTIEPTVVVHEAFLRLIGEKDLNFNGRAQFFGLASRIMRNVIVDHCRHRNRAKRGGEQIRVSISHIDREINLKESDFLRLHDALVDLEAIKPVHARVVELRFFGGLSVTETSEVLNVSPATVERYWTYSRAWLADALGSSNAEDDGGRSDR
jgi:RNA polymerase sigma-70 factor (ECF subfamily)